MNVLTLNGLSMRSEPFLGSEKITLIPFGSKIEIIKENSKTDFGKLLKIEEIEGFYISGYWKKAIFENDTGFVFGGYLTNLPIQRPEDVKGFALGGLKPKSERYHLKKFHPAIETSEPCGFEQEMTCQVKIIQNVCEESDPIKEFYFENRSLQEVYLFLKAVLQYDSFKKEYGTIRYDNLRQEIHIYPTGGIAGCSLVIELFGKNGVKARSRCSC
ncbi:MAG: hypothetical protein ACI81T_002653 [Bacteroidia bacterium]|jgi:hypothetical protein